jgi:hypothetical protein
VDDYDGECNLTATQNSTKKQIKSNKTPIGQEQRNSLGALHLVDCSKRHAESQRALAGEKCIEFQ